MIAHTPVHTILCHRRGGTATKEWDSANVPRERDSCERERARERERASERDREREEGGGERERV